MILIVSRYNENVEWTRQFSNVLIYNKGEELVGFSNVINTENVGREGHTYYKYICDNYDNLEDYTIFLQGNPFDHSPNIISNINKFIDYINRNQIIQFEYLSERIFYCTLNGCSQHPGLQLMDTYDRIFAFTSDIKPTAGFIFGAGAQFIVSKAQILKRPKSFYENIVKILEYSVNPMEGFVVERLHGLVLGQ